jgi:peptidoglycan/xylan/chitin deacetylase (PgdA/CDA1 family)
MMRNAFIAFIFFCGMTSSSWAKLYFTINFDDAWGEHYDASLVLDRYGFKGTFFANSGRSGTYEYMTHSKLIDMQARGHEIGGHTVHHFNLTDLNSNDREYEICQDIANLKRWQLNINNFAYPFSATFDGSDDLVKSCGYTSSRISGGLWTPHSCTNCQSGLRLPLKNTSALRSISYRSFMHTTDVITIIDRAMQAAVAQDTWLIFIFHRIANFTNDYTTYLYNNQYNPLDDMYNSTINIILYQDMVNILDYLHRTQVTVLTIRDMMIKQGFLVPATASPTTTPTTSPSSGVTLSASIKGILFVVWLVVMVF